MDFGYNTIEKKEIKNKMLFDKLNTPNDPFCQIITDAVKFYVKAFDFTKKGSGTNQKARQLIKSPSQYFNVGSTLFQCCGSTFK